MAAHVDIAVNQKWEEDAMEDARSMEKVAGRITVDEFTQVTFNAVLKALQERKVPHGPLIYGIIWLPEGVRSGVGAEATVGRSAR